MKIAIWHNLPSGGGKRALFALARGLHARGHELAAWCSPSAARDYLPLSGFMSERVVARRTRSHQAWHRLLPGRAGFGRHYAEFERHCRACAAEIDAGGYDVVLVANCGLFAVPPLARFLRTRSVHYCQELMRRLHEADLQIPRAGRIGYKLRRAWDAWLSACERRDLAAYDHVLVNSFYSRESLLRVHGQEATVCYLGTDATLFQPGAETRDRMIIGLGALQRHKDPLIAIHAVATLPEPDRPELIWIGNATDRLYLAQLQQEAGSRGVRFTPRHLIPDAELVAELGRACAMIYTSKLEPFGFAPLEANACETPVVAIAEGGVRETVRDGHNGLLVGGRDPVALGQRLAELLREPTRARRMGQRGRAEVLARWSWTKSVERLETILAETAGGSQFALGSLGPHADGFDHAIQT